MWPRIQKPPKRKGEGCSNHHRSLPTPLRLRSGGPTGNEGLLLLYMLLCNSYIYIYREKENGMIVEQQADLQAPPTITTRPGSTLNLRLRLRNRNSFSTIPPLTRPTFTPQEATQVHFLRFPFPIHNLYIPSSQVIFYMHIGFFFRWFSALILGFYDTILTMRIVGQIRKHFPTYAYNTVFGWYSTGGVMHKIQQICHSSEL